MPILAELQWQARTNHQNLINLINSVWGPDDNLRSFSPLAKGFLKPGQLVFAHQQFTQGERMYIKLFAQTLCRIYGKPNFKYTGMNDTIPAVKQFQNLARFSPKITPGASQRRFENYFKYFDKTLFKPDETIFKKAITITRELMNLPEVKVNYEPTYVRGLFASHASNVGYPYFANEQSNDNYYRNHTIDVAKRLLKEQNSAKWIVSLPAIIIGRDQPGGNTLDLDADYTEETLLKALDDIQYKPSKARVV